MEIQELARIALSHLTTGTRTDGSTYRHRTSTSPEWMQELCFAAHDAGEQLPNDERYEMTNTALTEIAEGADAPETDAPIYTAELTAWLASRNDRYCYCDDAAKEYDLGPDAGMIQRLQLGWLAEYAEVFQEVYSFLENQAEEMTLEEEEAEAAQA